MMKSTASTSIGTNTDVDIAICGAGPVGLALAVLLVQRGVPPARIALIDAKTLEQTHNDPRSIALSYGSRQILEQASAWPIAATEIHQIHVSRRGYFGRTLIDRTEHHVPALGVVTRYGTIVSALAATCAASSISTLRPARVASFSEQASSVELQMADGTALTTDILVQAEGGLFAEQTSKSLRRDYQQTAILAHVATSSNANNTIAHRAYERFSDEGPLALLPQHDDMNGAGYSLVWCIQPATSARLLSLDDAAFLAELENAFGQRLGRFVSTTPRKAYPLGLNAHPATSPRTVAIGNAAQTLHPVAGQGLNLGLRDAMVLARLLAQEASPATLSEFHQLRQSDRNLTVRLTDTMARVFTKGGGSPFGAISQALLGASLGAIDTVAPARYLLAELMMFGNR